MTDTSNWIEVENGLPDVGQGVVAYVHPQTIPSPRTFSTTFCGVLNADVQRWFVYEGCGAVMRVTHWQPLPEPPQARAQDGQKEG